MGSTVMQRRSPGISPGISPGVTPGITPGTRPGDNPGDNSRPKLPREIWVLGFVSMFMDTSSELVHSLLPVYLTTVLGASMITIGVIEGIAEATAAITKVFSGVISDFFRKRKRLIVLGYGLAAFTKPVFPLATTVEWVFAARFVDRIGKGIRGAPRDALIADVTPQDLRGAAFGLRQALDTVGAFIGPVLALGFLAWFANDLRSVLWIAVVPAFIALLLIVVAVHEPGPSDQERGGVRRLSLRDARLLPHAFWVVVALGAVFTLARFSEAFLILRAQDVGLGIGYVPAIMIVMNVVYATVAFPAGAAADRFPPHRLLILGLAILVVADALFAFATDPVMALAGAALWGLHMALTQGLLSKLVADTAPATLRGTAFGIFNLVAGVALLLASVIAGAMWTVIGPAATFLTGAVFAGLTALGTAGLHTRISLPDRTAGR